METIKNISMLVRAVEVLISHKFIRQQSKGAVSLEFLLG